jgi:hypothetical protein
MSVTVLLQSYANRIRELRRAKADVPETALAPAFQQLLEGLLALLPLAPKLIVMPEYRNPGVGRPDIALMRKGAPARAFVELKAPSKPADPTRWRDQDKKQFERFRELPCWATCNFIEFRLFYRGEEFDSAVVLPERALRADQDDARANRAIAEHDAAGFLRLVEMLSAGAGQEPSARDAEHLATMMAHSARLVRGIVRDRLAELHEAGTARHALLQVRQEFGMYFTRTRRPPGIARPISTLSFPPPSRRRWHSGSCWCARERDSRSVQMLGSTCRKNIR